MWRSPFKRVGNDWLLFLSTCAVKSCFHANAIRDTFHISDMKLESQRRAYDKDCNM